MLSLKDFPDASVVDGSWRDIFVLGTTTTHWEQMLRLVRDRKTIRHTFSRSGRPVPIPDELDDGCWMNEHGDGAFLTVDLDGLVLRCHFFAVEEIQLDYNPSEITESRFHELIDFMESLGRRLQREVRLTPEDTPEQTILRYDPERDRVTKE